MKNIHPTSRLRSWFNNLPIPDPVNRRMAGLLQVMLVGFMAIVVISSILNIVVLQSGIESQHLRKIFGLFEKLDQNSEGTGIGLALIKRIIETHGGKIWVESDGLEKVPLFTLRFLVEENNIKSLKI